MAAAAEMNTNVTLNSKSSDFDGSSDRINIAISPNGLHFTVCLRMGMGQTHYTTVTYVLMKLFSTPMNSTANLKKHVTMVHPNSMIFYYTSDFNNYIISQ